MSIALGVQVERVLTERPLRCLPLTVSIHQMVLRPVRLLITNNHPIADAKQARDLVNVLVESKQQIDPRLSEMARYGGGGGGGGRSSWGGRGRGGGRGGGGGYSGSNAAPMGGSRRW